MGRTLTPVRGLIMRIFGKVFVDFISGVGLIVVQRKTYCKDGTFIFLTVDLYFTTVLAHYLGADIQPEPYTRITCRPAVVQPVIPVEDLNQTIFGDAHAKILYGNGYLPVAGLRPDDDLVRAGRIVDGVAQQIDHYLP